MPHLRVFVWSARTGLSSGVWPRGASLQEGLLPAVEQHDERRGQGVVGVRGKYARDLQRDADARGRI